MVLPDENQMAVCDMKQTTGRGGRFRTPFCKWALISPAVGGGRLSGVAVNALATRTGWTRRTSRGSSSAAWRNPPRPPMCRGDALRAGVPESGSPYVHRNCASGLNPHHASEKMLPGHGDVFVVVGTKAFRVPLLFSIPRPPSLRLQKP